MNEKSFPVAESLQMIDAEGLRRFLDLQGPAVAEVKAVLDATYAAKDWLFAEYLRESCEEDLTFLLEFLRPVLEFGMLKPLVDYLHWLDHVLTARSISTEHLVGALEAFAEYFDEHMAMPLRGVVVTALNAAREKFLTPDVTPVVMEPPAPWPEVGEMESVLLAGDQQKAMDMMNEFMDQGRSLVELELHLLQPALYSIGEKWQANQVSVVQEHMASAIVQSLMSWGLTRSRPSNPNGKRIMLACAEGNHHSMGLRMVADAFQLAGWDIEYLGENVSTSLLLDRIPDSKPDLVGISVSFPQHMLVVKKLITQLKARLGEARPPVIVGGLAVNRFNQLANALGADASGGTSELAVQYANRLVGG